ncbi:heterokaryon incompatibility protein-domain-containing protein, partial [Rhexocercosporidium sp. MPI-PUGE-AT-0058]
MWLIETKSLKLEFFIGNNIPEYAILSHTWGDGEVTFQDWQNLQEASKKPGFAKIQSACTRARDDYISYIWVDTNCIDKSSSAELSEAINSMFAWYRDSKVCYVHLADHFERQDSVEDTKKARFIESFRNSRWFTRGWTLQELLAPACIRFFTHDWKPIIMKWPGYFDFSFTPSEAKGHQRLLLELLSDITGIRLNALTFPQSIVHLSNGEKMSWIAGRETTREEDIAYCLLGIFDINMPLLYGEGNNAFKRLQEEIMKQSTDHTLFAWQW